MKYVHQKQLRQKNLCQKRMRRVTLSLFDAKNLQFFAQHNRLIYLHHNDAQFRSLYSAITSITGRPANSRMKYNKFRNLATLAWHMLLEKQIKDIEQLAKLEFDPNTFHELFEKNQTVEFAA